MKTPETARLPGATRFPTARTSNELAIQAGERNFQRVCERNHILHIQHCTQLVADQFAIFQRDAIRQIDKNSQNRMFAGAFKLQINKLIALTFDNFGHNRSKACLVDSHALNNKKVGGTPTRKSSQSKV